MSPSSPAPASRSVDELTRVLHCPARPEVHRMGKWLQDELVKLGAEIRSVPMGPQTLDGQTVELPPVLVGSLGKDPKKKTILL